MSDIAYQTSRLRRLREGRRRAPLSVLALGMLASLFPSAALGQGDNSPFFVDKLERATYERVSVAADGTQGDGNSGYSCASTPSFDEPTPVDSPSMSDNGRFIAFTSSADNLTPDDANGSALTDVFLRDRKKGTTELVSAMGTGLAPSFPSQLQLTGCTRWSWNPSISGNGRYVAFASRAALVPGMGDLGTPALGLNVYVRDLKKKETELVSVAAGSTLTPVAGRSGRVEIGISQDGRRVVFLSDSPDLVSDGCGSEVCRYQAYLRDRKDKTTSLISRSSDGSSADQPVDEVQISDDGNSVVFTTRATNLMPQPDLDDGCEILVRGCSDIFLFDVRKDKVEQVSLNNDGENNQLGAWFNLAWGQRQVISADGRFVVFGASGTDMVPSNDPFASNYLVRDMKTERIERISVDSIGTQTTAVSFTSISDSGRYVAMGATSLDGGCSSPLHCYLVYDRNTGQADIASLKRTNGDGPALSGDARYLGFTSRDSDYVDNDSNGFDDVFVAGLGKSNLGIAGMGFVSKPPARELGAAEEDNQVTHFCVEGACIPSQGVISSFDSEQDLGEALTKQGANLYGASLAYRPELNDIFVAIELEHMPQVLPGLSPIFYGLRFRVGDKGYEVRATSLLDGTFGMFDCSDGLPTCNKVVDLRGGYGTTGMRVVFSLPLDKIGLENGGDLSGVEAFSGLGSSLTGATRVLDTVKIR